MTTEDLSFLDHATPIERGEPEPKAAKPKQELAKAPTTIEGGKVQLRDSSQVSELAAFVTRSGMKIGGATTHADITLCLMAGLEAGLSATATMKNIMVVNGRPTIWGDALVSLVLGSGQCLKLDAYIVGDDDQRAGVCELGRRMAVAGGHSDCTITRTFSVADAKTAGLWGKAGPWKNYPERMLCNRARTFAIRDLFADFIGGLSVREEVEDYTGGSFDPDQMRVSSNRPTPDDIIDAEATVTEGGK